MTILWTDKTAAEATQGKAQGGAWEAMRVDIDSRRMRRGDLFIALKGDRFDGHDYVAKAFENGAVAAVVSHVPDGAEGKPLILVPDTQQALENLGRFARARSRAKIVGVTGSVGKTGAKEMLRLALSAHGETYASSGNFNNHIGAPLNLANLAPAMPFAVFEMGMNHAGEIARLTRLVRPHVAAITGVEAVHIEFFDSLEEIALAKAEIFTGLDPNGVAVLNRDNASYPTLVKQARACRVANIITFGEHTKAECRLRDYGSGSGGAIVSADISGKVLDYTLAATGRHWALSSLLTLAAVQALGLDVTKSARALVAFREPEGRGRLVPLAVKGGDAILIDDSYNASPASMRAGFAKTAEVWKAHAGQGRKLAALGDMLELGAQAPSLHASLAPDLEHHGFDGVFTAGSLMRHLYDALPQAMRLGHADTVPALLPILQKELRDGDILLVKGSHGSKMYELAKALAGPASAAKEKKHAV